MRPDLRTILLSGSSLRRGLIAYWKLEESSGTRLDSVGSSHLTDINTVTGNPGKIGNAGQFTAANGEYLSRSDGGLFNIGSNPTTIAGWIYIDSLAVNRSLFSKRTGGNDYIADVTTTGEARFLVWVAAAAKTAATPTLAVPATTWCLIICQFDPVTQLAGVSVNNGTLATVATTSGTIDSTTTAFHLGASNAATVMDGRMDEWGFWRRLLTSTEKAQLYNAGNGTTLF